MFSSRIKSEQADNLARAILALNTEEDCYKLFEDLFTIREIQDLGQRLEVARQLTAGKNYNAVCADTGASSATISRVNRCLQYGGGGYRTVLERMEADGND